MERITELITAITKLRPLTRQTNDFNVMFNASQEMFRLQSELQMLQIEC